MNLIPIDAGGTPPDLAAGPAAPDGEFAALITGLMAGDTQIVPLLELLTDQPPSGTEDENPSADGMAPIFEFVAAPTAGVVPVPIVDTTAGEPTPVTEMPAETASTPQLVPPLESLPDESTTDAAEGAIAAATAGGLATVHPISKLSPSPAADTESTEVEEARATGATRHQAVPHSTESRPVETRLAPDHNTIDGAPGALRTQTPATESTVDRQTTTAQDSTQLELDPEVATTTRPSDAARPAATFSQPVMVGIARRVEEAIQALAAKPDPKVVTLQLDELDGLRLTVALRPDGLHLSSTGDARLTTEIERALTSRGFDLASGGRQNQQPSREGTDDGWRPQSTPNVPTRPTNPSGIRL